MPNPKKKPVAPENATVRFGARFNNYGSTRQPVWFKTEDEARSFAASGESDGSGIVFKRTSWWETSKEPGSWSFTQEAHLDEELKPVTVFSKNGGEFRRKKFLKVTTCEHKKTRSRKEGAGCDTWFTETCTECGAQVA